MADDDDITPLDYTSICGTLRWDEERSLRTGNPEHDEGYVELTVRMKGETRRRPKVPAAWGLDFLSPNVIVPWVTYLDMLNDWIYALDHERTRVNKAIEAGTPPFDRSTVVAKALLFGRPIDETGKPTN